MLYKLNLHDLLQPSVRKTHCSGRKHKENVKDYYQKWMEEQAQSLIDKTSKANPFVIFVCFAVTALCPPSAFLPIFPAGSLSPPWWFFAL